jgi:hypothetical protein
VIVAVEPAHAICGHELWWYQGPVVDGLPRGHLERYGATCDGDGTYIGALFDIQKDGKGVFLYLCDRRVSGGILRGCSEYYDGTAADGGTIVSKTDLDGVMFVQLRWGSVRSPILKMTGF